jgi:hypothetical protein
MKRIQMEQWTDGLIATHIRDYGYGQKILP